MTDNQDNQAAVEQSSESQAEEPFTVAPREGLATAQQTVTNLQRLIIGSQEKTPPGTLPGLAGRLMEHAGDIPGKYDPPIALSTHTINAIVTGVSTYVYDQRVLNGVEEIDYERVRLLVGALALHDANKYVEGRFDVDFDTRNNTGEVLEFYFEQGDPLGITDVLPGNTEDELALDIADVKWLVQRTETKDATTATRGESTQRVRGLERYCRAGDGFVSKVHADGLSAGVRWLGRYLEPATNGESTHVHHIGFNELEQSVLNGHLLATVKHTIRGTNEYGEYTTRGILLGSTPDGVAYLGEPIDREQLRDAVSDTLMQRVLDKHSFNAKTEWNAFEYDILAEIDTPLEKKRSNIAEGFAATLASGSGTDHVFETVPDGFRAALPELAKVVFKDKNYDEAFAEYPEMQTVWEFVDTGDEYNSFTRKIGYMAELLRGYLGALDAVDVDSDALVAELETFSEEHRDALGEALEPEASTGTVAVDRFFGGGIEQKPTLPGADKMCFLCGRPASTDYKKGQDAFYGTQSYSKRVPPEANYKKICPVCNLEHALLRDTIERHDYNADEDIKIAFVYYDEFVADIGIQGSGEPDGLIRALQADEDDAAVDIADPELVATSFGRQYHLQPLYIDSENTRLRQIRELLVDLVAYGFQVVLGKPFAGFQPQQALFADLNPSRRQTNFGADRVGSFTDLERLLQLFDLLREAADSSDYTGGREMTQIQTDAFEPIADLIAQNTEYRYDARSIAHDYFQTYHNNSYMQMRTIAANGLELYGPEFGSRHKKTKIFRRAVDATLDGLNRNMTDEQLHEHVSGQVYKAATADAEKDHYVQPEDAEAFVTALFKFLREQGDLGKSGLSQRRNALSNTYLFAYDQLLREEYGNDDEETEAST